MTLFVRSSISTDVDSFETGVKLARNIVNASDGEKLSGIIAYSTVNHDSAALLAGIRDSVGAAVPVIGCSSQGIMSRGVVIEEGYAAGAMGLGGTSLEFVGAFVEEFHRDCVSKGRALGRALRDRARQPLRVVVLHYDPLCGADVEAFLSGLYDEVQCPIVGGAAAEFWGPMERTFQYFENRALSHAAVAAGLSGSFELETDLCHGTSPVGIEMSITRAEHNKVLEFDGRPALEVWEEFCSAAPQHIDHSGAIGIGLPTSDPDVYVVRCAFGVDAENKGVIFQAGMPLGANVSFNHRTVDGALDGTKRMGARLAERLRGKNVRGVLGFECGARTKPFLGSEATLAENVSLQEQLAPDAAWLGMIAWGEVSSFDGKPGFANFTYPLLVLAE